jgi:DUF2971 family protein
VRRRRTLKTHLENGFQSLSFGMMDRSEPEISLKLLARANPPPMLHRYRKPNERALEEIIKQQIFATSPDGLNDPFEYAAPVFWGRDSLRQYFIEKYAPEIGLSAAEAAKQFDTYPHDRISQKLRAGLVETRQNSGIICLTAVPNSIRMWSYYGQAHEGICVGFDTKTHPFMAAMKVVYQNPDALVDVASFLLLDDPSKLAAHISLRKAAEWEFEQEYRIPIDLTGNYPRLMAFDPSAIAEIRFGARIKDDFRHELMKAISHLPRRPKLIQMRCDLARFVLTEEIISP